MKLLIVFLISTLIYDVKTSYMDYDITEFERPWPAALKAIKTAKFFKRGVERQSHLNPQNEGGPLLRQQNDSPTSILDTKVNTTNIEKPDTANSIGTAHNTTKTEESKVLATTSVQANSTVNSTAPSNISKININNPGVLKRALIVFGGFSLLGVAYYIFFKRKGSKSNSNINSIESQQFRYGVLLNDDQRDNLELSRVPLTMDSDDDEDEDLEIFDLGEKRKTVNPYPVENKRDVDLVYPGHEGGSQDNNEELLLDMEDSAGDKLINWSNSESRSIL